MRNGYESDAMVGEEQEVYERRARHASRIDEAEAFGSEVFGYDRWRAMNRMANEARDAKLKRKLAIRYLLRGVTKEELFEQLMLTRGLL